MNNYQINEAKRIGLQRTIDSELADPGIYFGSGIRRRGLKARAVRAENIRRTAAAS